MAAQQRVQATSFTLVLEKFKASLTDKEKREFAATSLQDLHATIEGIQKKQMSEKKLQAMHRLEVFLEGMKEYDKVVSVFLNTSELLAFVWGPMKFILQVASTFAESFDSLMDAYQRIGEHIPLLTQYEQYFRDQPQMAQILKSYYEDILTFHWKAMKFFKPRIWKQLFQSVWKSFNADFAAILRNMREHRSLIESQVNITQFGEIMATQYLTKAAFEKQKEIENHRRREIVYQWLSSAKAEVDQETYTKVRRKYPTTGQWLLKANRFHSWFDPDYCSNHLLWLSGIPGAGKTILASMVIEEARKLKDVCVAFFFCKYQDTERNTFLAVARGLLAQLLHQDDGLLPYLYEKASKSGQVNLSTESLAKELLATSLQDFEKLYVVLDGLDECEREERREIATFFEKLWESIPPQDADSLRCMFISQDDSAARKDFRNMVSLKVTESSLKQDIRIYASDWSAKIQEQFDLADDTRIYIEDMITNKAEGMFLFARLMASYLLDQTSRKSLEVELALGNFPQGPLRLDEVYSRIIRHLCEGSGQRKSQSMKLLSWLICAKRRLKWHEIQCAVSIDVEEQTVDWENNRFRVDSKELCGSLVEIYTDGAVGLVHPTAERYLVEKRFVDHAAEEASFTLLCIGYLSFPSFDRDIEEDDVKLYLSLGFYGFFDYAYAYWSRHLDKSMVAQIAEHTQCDINEAVGVFIDMHWNESQVKTSVPKSLLERLKPLRKAHNFDKIASAVYLGRKHLNASVKQSPDEQVLNLSKIMDMVRASLEELDCSAKNTDKFREMHGSHIYKCPRMNCTRFYNGFTTKQQRDDHVPKHERLFFCTFSGCPSATLGCATLKELQKHETEFHGTIDLDDDEADFPELPPEKVSFDCTQCNATFTRKHNLNNHIRTAHNAPNVKSFICSTCGKRFARQGDRSRHESTSHSGAKTFTCGGTLKDGTIWGCGRVFNRGDVLNRHYKSEKGRECIRPKEEEEAAETGTSTPSLQQSGTPQPSI